MDLREFAKELGAGYILEGSVRKSGDKIRITGQLIDAEGRHVWADRYDRDLSDMFELQDEITSTIVGALAPEIDNADTRRIHSKPTENMTAWDCVLRALSLGNETFADSLKEGYALAEKAVELDPQFTQAHAILAGLAFSNFARLDGKALGLGPAEALDKAAEHATKALSIDRSFPFAHGILGVAHAYRQNVELGLKKTAEAVRLNPSDTQIRLLHSQTLALSRDFEAALEQIEIGKRLSPGDPGIGRMITHEANYLLAIRRRAHRLHAHVHDMVHRLKFDNFDGAATALKATRHPIPDGHGKIILAEGGKGSAAVNGLGFPRARTRRLKF